MLEALVRTLVKKWFRVTKKKKKEIVLKDILVRERYEEGNSL